MWNIVICKVSTIKKSVCLRFLTWCVVQEVLKITVRKKENCLLHVMQQVVVVSYQQPVGPAFRVQESQKNDRLS
jgi:hypothetical protein